MTYWYLVKVRHEPQDRYVIPAKSGQAARRLVGLFALDGDVEQLTWAAIKRVLGCEIPDGVPELDHAHGLLTFRRYGDSIGLWVGG